MKANIRRVLFLGILEAVLPGLLAAPPVMAQTPLFARGYAVIPEPQQVELKGDDFEFGRGWRLNLGSGVKADDVAVESLKEDLSSRDGVTLETAKAGRAITLTIQTGSVPIGNATDTNRGSLEEQAYKLVLGSDGIEITANAPAGLFYGVDTLVQLVKPAEGKLWLPGGTITDWPDLELRNIYWDDAHHLEHLDVLKEAMRRAASYKINGFVIKLEGHFDFASAPALVEPYALSPEQLQELTDYGLRYHIQLIPYLDAPAHISFILKHPEYAGLREYQDSNYELCVTNPDSYKLLDGMYQNLMDANKGVKYFVLSTDEAYYAGLADNDQCHEAQQAKELGSVGKLLAAFLDKAAGYLHDHGRTVVFWGEYPMKPDDIPSLPSYLVNGEVYGREFDRAFKARGIRQMIFTSSESSQDHLFPSYYIHPDPHGPAGLTAGARPPAHTLPGRMTTVFDKITSPESRTGDLMGVFLAAWADSGLHPETFWMSYATGSSWAWHLGSPTPSEAESSFFRLFYGQGATDMARVYQLMSTQATLWLGTWDQAPSSARKPIFGSSYEIFKVRHPAHDQTLQLPPVPQGEFLRLPFDWGMENTQRLKMAEDSMPALDELYDLLRENLRSVEFNHYNLEVFLSIAGLYRQNLEMLQEMGEIDSALKAAQGAAAEVPGGRGGAQVGGGQGRAGQGGPVGALDRALDIAQRIKSQRNAALQSAVKTWYQSWYPRVEEANGRKYLDEVDDVKDHVPVRTVDMSYLVLREMILPLGQWYDQVEAERNRYAQAHHQRVRDDKLDWEDTKTVREGD